MSKRALGKGMSALLPDDDFSFGKEPTDSVKAPDKERTSREQIQYVSLEKLVPNPDQPRKTFESSSLHELADSIRSKGIIQPLLVEKTEDQYQIIVGERRFRAAQLAGLTELPVVCKELSGEERLEIALIENIQREDLNPIEEAEAYQHIMVKTGLSQEEVAGKVGKQRSTIANSLRLLKLSEEMQEAIISGTMSAGHARAVLSVVNRADQEILFRNIVGNGISVREAEKKAVDLNTGKRMKGAGEKKKTVRKAPEILEIEEMLIGFLGTKVAVQGSLARGKIIIDYFSQEDLERVYDLLFGKTE